MAIRKLFNYWISKDRGNFYFALAVLFSLAYLFGTWMQSSGAPELGRRFRLAGFVGFLVLVVVYFVHRNLNAYYDFLEMFKDTDHLPQKQIAYVNSFCMTVFLIAAVILLIVMVFTFEPLWQAISEWFANRPKLEVAQEIPQEYIPLPTPTAPNLQALLGEPEAPAPTPAWVSILNQLSEILAIGLLIFGIIYVIRHGAEGVWDFITRPRHFDEDEKIYLKPSLDMLAHLAPPEAEEAQQKKGLKYFLSYEARIRRHYKKQILTGRKQQHFTETPGEWSSPSELEQDAGLDDATLHRLYEKARYSYEECTEDDWKTLDRKSHS